MENIPEILFWSAFACICYTYGGYYLCLRMLAVIQTRRYGPEGAGKTPGVSVIISAFNEEAGIAERIENLLDQDYPSESVEIVIGSDGSTDGTAEVARGYSDRGVRVLEFGENRGKAAVNNECVRAATREILVFTDSDTVFDRGFLRNIVRGFEDPSVGLITGRLVYRTGPYAFESAEGSYLRYELALRRLESRLGILFSASGACFAMRRELYRELGRTVGEDFALPVICLSRGGRVVMDDDAVAHDIPHGSAGRVLRGRIRITSRAFSGLLSLTGPAFWIRHPGVAWAMFSHKYLRWLTGAFMLSLLVLNALVLDAGRVYVYTMYIQAGYYLLCMAGGVCQLAGLNVRPARWAFAFLSANIGMSVGILLAILGEVPARHSETG